MKYALRTAVVAPPVLLFLQAVTAGLLLPNVPPPEGGGMALVLSTVFTGLLLAGLALTLAVGGWARVAILALTAGGIPLNNLLEAFFFPLGIPRPELVGLFLQTALTAVLFAAILGWLAGPARAARFAGSPRTPTEWVTRIAASDALYMALYLGAGLLVWPFVRHFYEGRAMPSLPAVMAMQVFRGLVFTAIVGVLTRNLPWTRLTNAIAVGLTLSLLGGVIPLLAPNPYMPASIRWPHMVETGTSNFLFGLIGAWWLGLSSEPATRPVEERALPGPAREA